MPTDSSYEQARLEQIARLDAWTAERPPVVFDPVLDSEHPDSFHDPDDPAAAEPPPDPDAGAGA